MDIEERWLWCLLEFKNYLIKNNITELLVEEYSHKILSFYNFYGERLKYNIFKCTEMGVYPEDTFLNYSSSKNYIVIFSSICDVLDSYSIINVTIEPIQSIDDLRIYRIVHAS